MNRRSVLQIAGTILVSPGWAIAQTPKKYRIGLLASGTQAASITFIEALLAGMRERGYTPGDNLILDVRYGEGDSKRFPALADELIALKPDVLLGLETVARVMAAKTKTIPIVLATSIDPVAAGLVKSLARPDTNVTGFVDLWGELIAKHVDLILEAVPKASRIGVLSDPTWSARAQFEQYARTAASAKKLSLTLIPVAGPVEIQQAFDGFAKNRIDILVISSTVPIFTHRRVILENVRRLRLPAIWGITGSVEDSGVLLCYGPNVLENLKQCADFIDRILKGANPGDLPVRQTAKFDFVVNLKIAREIGVNIPQSILLRADRVIE
jgi:putative ABC transport system substrate-binding protein